jgi:hypothetical protein
LIVLKHVYLYRDETTENVALPITRPSAIALMVLALGVILIGTVFAPWFNAATAGALNLF